MKRILVAEDDADIRETLKDLLSGGKNPAGIDNALAKAEEVLAEQIK